MAFYQDSPLPLEVGINQSAVPVFTSAGDPAMVVTSRLTDLSDISFYNANSVSLNITVTDGNDNAVANISSWPVDPSSPTDFQFRVPIRCVSGIKVYANSTGLKFNMRAHRHPGFTAQ